MTQMDSAPVPLSRRMAVSPATQRRAPDPFALLYRANLAFVSYVALLAGVRRADVADVVQEVFVILHREMGRGLDTSTSVRGWLKRTTFRRARDHQELAMHRELPAPDLIIDSTDPAPSPEDSMQAIDTREHVLAVLSTLTHDQRLVLVMHDAQEMPMSEVAEVLESPVGTCYTRLHAARKAFRRAWDDRRASGLAAIAPLALWDAESLLDAAKPVPEPPPGFEDEVWRRLADSLGPRITGAGAAAAAGGALRAGASKAGVVLTAKQIVLGAAISAMAGAGLHAAARSAVDTPAPPGIASAAADTERLDQRGAGTAWPVTPSPAATTAASVAPGPLAEPSVRAPTVASATPRHDEAAERLLLDTARAAIERGDLAAARAALARIKSPRFAAERDELRRIVLSYQDGGPR